MLNEVEYGITFSNAFNSNLSASSEGARDFEFYAWIGGCFEFGELKRKQGGEWVDDIIAAEEAYWSDLRLGDFAYTFFL